MRSRTAAALAAAAALTLTGTLLSGPVNAAPTVIPAVPGALTGRSTEIPDGAGGSLDQRHPRSAGPAPPAPAWDGPAPPGSPPAKVPGPS